MNKNTDKKTLGSDEPPRLQEELKIRRGFDDDKSLCGHSVHFLRASQVTNDTFCTICYYQSLEKSLRQIYIIALRQQLPEPLSVEALISAVMLSIPNNLKSQVTAKELQEISKILSPIRKKM